jgi:hypothetical protein
MPDENNKAKLLGWLQLAAELELATIPPYLTALLSIQRPASREAAELIRSVMIEEMLHLALVANIMTGLGGGVRLRQDNIPRYPLVMYFEGKPFKDRRFTVDLAPYSESVIRTFMKLEEPAWLAGAPQAFALEMDIPGVTIGSFYRNIETLLEELNGSGSAALFSGNPAHQITEDYYWSSGGRVIAVTDLTSAKAALDIVIRQGEGAWQWPQDGTAARLGHQLEMGHYFRFSEILHGARYQATDDPAGDPTGDALEVNYNEVYPFKANAQSADYADGTTLQSLNRTFNLRYTAMLQQLEESFNGNPRTLYTAIIDGMHTLAPIALTMMQTGIEGDAQGRTGCPTFEWLEQS